MRSFWPASEAAQADYEALREAVLAGTPLVGPAGARFARGGLAALIARPEALASFLAILVGARRPAWSPSADPPLDALAEGYEFLLAVPEPVNRDKEAAR